MITDNTGRKLKVGQMVNLMLMGTFTAKLLSIRDQPIALSPEQMVTPHILIGFNLTLLINQHGVSDVYVVREPDPKDPLVIEAAELEKGKIIRMPH